jgi:hypothetical protein
VAYLTREQILQAADIRFEDVEVPEWGGTVRVRSLTGAERDDLEGSIAELEGLEIYENFRARLVTRAVVDETGKRLFSDKDIERLGEKSGAALDRVFSVAQRLSGLTKADIEELTANLNGGQS